MEDIWVSCYKTTFRNLGSQSLPIGKYLPESSFISEDMFPSIMIFQKVSSHLCLASSIYCITLFQIPSSKTTWDFGTYLAKHCYWLVPDPIFENCLRFWKLSSKIKCHFGSYLPICYILEDLNSSTLDSKCWVFCDFLEGLCATWRGLKSNFRLNIIVPIELT
jgi:hypothetical protein